MAQYIQFKNLLKIVILWVVKKINLGLPGGPAVGGPDLLASCMGHGFHSLSGKIPHTEGQLSLCMTTTETHLS